MEQSNTPAPESALTSAPDPAAALLPDQTPDQESSDPATPEGTPPSTADADSDRPSRAQQRIEELAAEKQAARDAAEYWRDRALAAPLPATPAPTEEQPPKFADYETADDWAAAHAAFVEKRAETRANTAAETRFQKERIEAAENATRTAFEERVSKFKTGNPGVNFDAIVGNPRLPITTAMAEVIQTSETGPEMIVHLGLHPEKAARIALLRSPAQQAAALGRLEAELKSKPAAPVPRARTNAPPPPTPVGNSPASKSMEDMSIDEYMAHRAQNWGKRR